MSAVDGAERRRILVITNEVLGPRMAGPAIRAREMSRLLAERHHVVLGSLEQPAGEVPGVRTAHVSSATIDELVGWAEIIVFGGHFLSQFAGVPGLPRKILVVDLYTPMQLEQLELGRFDDLADRLQAVDETVGVVNQQLDAGDFFLCANDRQRDLWIGALATRGRLNPLVYDDDPSLRRLIEVAPFGLSPARPDTTGRPLRQVPGIGDDDPVIVWGGGIYNWFDPVTLIEAVDVLRARIPDVRLYFMGLQHPNPHVPAMEVARQAERRAVDLGLLDRHVFFNRGWIPYEDRHNYLLDACVGVSTHRHHTETTFSFRTRILDYIWAGLPIVATDGDAFAAEIESAPLGLTVPPGDPSLLADALARLITDDGLRARCHDGLRGARGRYEWRTALAPLSAFCDRAQLAADRGCHKTIDATPATIAPAGSPIDAGRRWRWQGLRHDLRASRVVLATAGARGLCAALTARARRLVQIAERRTGRTDSP